MGSTDRVVVVGLKGGGGLGNQLFAYAAGRACALRTQSRLLFYDDLHVGPDSYPLSRVVGPSFELAMPSQLLRSLGIYSYQTRLGVTLSGLSHMLLDWRSAHRGHPMTLVQQPDQAYGLDRRVLAAQPPLFLSGYFQSELHFSDFADRIDADICLPPVDEVLTDRLPGPVVAVTFRRGDYVQLGWTLPLDYYYRAVEKCCASVGPGSLLVFSDDAEFAELVRPRLQRYAPVFVAPRYSRNPLEQLAMMASCDHHVLANSTYCWWGAWLSERRTDTESVIIAPSGWIDGNESILPERWTVVPVNSG